MKSRWRPPYPGARRIVSPDGRWSMHLGEGGEVRFGPEYFRVWLTREPAAEVWWSLGGEKFVGRHCRFSANSRFVVLEHWRDWRSGRLCVDFVSIELATGARRIVSAGIPTIAEVEARAAVLTDDELDVGVGAADDDWPFER